ncbi:ATP-dependent protease [Sphingomonas ginkgonis]|uniref:ATP-dependent protease n=1 Tax=Sphingomonas ginkgonis TaxID=2315330 RepID=A0A429V755_9SPHN|nr:LON peptidase substrate-binding domain-containing protein [Sphingomonas ginkgonis]RST29739.1 ATP-dependent protease [Sphingomonas ginkgonis]
MSRIQIPIFPLAGALLFPRAQLPLHIFEPRYREMVRDAAAGPGRIGMIQPSSLADGPERPPIAAVGCLGELVNVEELDDGRFNIVLQGSHRFRVVDELSVDTAYRQADVELGLFDDEEPSPLSIARRASVEEEARRLGDAMGLTVDWNAVNRLDDEMLVNAIAQVAPFDLGAKQALLEAVSLHDRADLLVQLMQFQRLALTGFETQPTLQ